MKRSGESVGVGRYGRANVDYQALYRKYRPETFDDVIGQAHVTTTLGREVAEGRIAHAYLFAGPRGTGKTTTARILAKALNCSNRQSGGSPCSQCDSCTSIAQGISLDVLELDAASHNSVDDIRDIRMSVTTVASVATSKRVFVLDEAHMLSKAAGNALLKTLEEPPEHVHFVLATTEPYKLLDTIRSRTQRFDFRPVAIEELAGYLSTISDREGYKTNPAALVAIARHAEGSVRDSLSLLEQVAALSAGKVDVAGVSRALGLADTDAFMGLATALARNDTKAGLELVAELAARGVDLRRFVSEAIGFFRGVFLAHYAPNLAEIADESDDVLNSWKKAAEVVPSSDVLRAVDLLADALIRLREGREERLMTELAVIKLTRPETSTDIESVVARMDRLERRLASAELGKPATVGSDPGGVAASTPSAPTPSASTPAASTAAERSPAPQAAVAQTTPAASEVASTQIDSTPAEASPTSSEAAEMGPPIDVSFDQLKKVWPGLFGSLGGILGARRWALFREAVPAEVVGNTIFLEVRHDFHLTALEQDDVVGPTVATKLGDLLGTPVRVRFRAHADTEGVDADTEPDQPDLPKVDKDQFEERPNLDTNAESLLASEFGAKLVDE